MNTIVIEECGRWAEFFVLVAKASICGLVLIAFMALLFWVMGRFAERFPR